MVTQPAKFKAVIHFWEDKQVFLFPWSLLSLKRSKQQVSHLWVLWETTTWKANVRYGKNRQLGFHFQAHSFVGHIYWWAAYFTDFSIGNWYSPFVSVRKQRQKGSPPPPPLSTCTILLTLQASVQLSPPLRVILDQDYTPSLTEWTPPSLYSTFY